MSTSSAPELNYADVDHLYASVAPQYLPRLYNSLDWNAYSIMSYDEYPGEDWSTEGISAYALEGHSTICACSSCRSDKSESIIDVSSGQRVIESSFMSLDILALMYIYNYDPASETWNIPSFNAGDDTYVIDGPVFMTIHDTGGRDIIDLSAFNFDISFNLNFFGPTWDEDTGQYILTYQHNEIGTDLLEYEDGEFYSGYIINASPFTIIEDLILGSGNDSVLASFDDTINNIEAGSGNDSIYYIGALDTVYGEEGDDYFQATLDTFTLIDGGIGLDTLTIDQALLDSGLYSVDLRGLNQGQVTNIELLNYGSDQVIGKGQILISGKTFKDFGSQSLVITATWVDGKEQGIGLEGNFNLAGSSGEYDIYTLSENGALYILYVWKDHYVFKIDDSLVELSLSNTIVAEETWNFVGHISLSGEDWMNPLSWANSMHYMPNYSLSGEDAELFEIISNQLYFISQPDYETKSTYSVTITGLSLSGKSVAKTFTVEIKDVDELSYTSSDDVITGTDSDDFLYGSSGNDTISGGLGNDNLTGGTGDDVLYGNEGDDSLFGWGGDDEIYGGIGNDLIYGHEDTDKLYGNEGSDTIYGWGGNDQIEGGTGDDVIYGDSGDDLLYGDLESGESDSDGNDIISAGTGDDDVWGGGGDDVIYGSSGEDTIRGGSGNDTLKGGTGNDILIGQSGNDILEGGDGDDLLYGDNDADESSTDGNDILFGGLGDDEIYGRGGDDYLVGQEGKDTLTGGEGSDVFVLTSYDITGPAQGDIIKDFVDGEDKIGLINLDFDSLTISQAGFGVDASTEITDANGNTLAILEGVTSDLITADDFVSLNYDLSEVIDTTASFFDLDFDSLGISGNPSQNINPAANGNGSANPDVPMTDDEPNFGDQINSDLIDSLINENSYDNYSINDFI